MDGQQEKRSDVIGSGESESDDEIHVCEVHLNIFSNLNEILSQNQLSKCPTTSAKMVYARSMLLMAALTVV